MQRITSVAALREAVGAHRARGARIAFVPTMGALHEGHLALVRAAADYADIVVVSIFVNPLQFDRGDDLAAYPRDLAADEAALAELGDRAPTLVFAPEVEEIYPRPMLTTVRVAGLTERLCGATRPGHFDGVATVVTKLLHIVAPDVAVFGRKDRQQLQIIARLVDDLQLPVRIVGVPTVRDRHGVAISSRLVRLQGDALGQARALPAALAAAVLAARDARRARAPVTAGLLTEAAAAALAPWTRSGLAQAPPPAAQHVVLDYLEVVDPATLAPPREDPDGESAADRAATLVVALAVFIGPVRLIDNVEVGDLEDEDRVLAHLGPNHASGLVAGHTPDREG